MSRRSERKKAAKAKAAPPPDFLHVAAGRVGPMVHGAADRMDPVAHSAANLVGTIALAVADQLAPATHAAADRVAPLANSAADRIAPLAASAADRLGPYAQQARDRVSPFAQLAADRVGPVASGAKKRGARVAYDALGTIGPKFDDAVESSRLKVRDDLLPKLTAALSAAAGSELVAEAARRGQATLAAAKGELELPPPKKKGRWLKRFAILAAIAGAAVVAARKFLGNADADWQAARPSTPYTPPQPAATTEPGSEAAADEAASPAQDSTSTVDGAAGSDDLTSPAPESASVSDDVPAPDAPTPDEGASLIYSTESDGLAEPTSATDGEVAATPPADQALPADEALPADQLISDDAPETSLTAPRYSGEGVYIGLEPPEGYTIKGNDRSKKYHVPESAGYARTAAEIWFNSEEAAERAGFMRAQR